MAKKKIENQKTFSDLSNKSWFKDGDNIKVGDSFPEIMSGKSKTLGIKDILFGTPSQTWVIVITKEDTVFLLKSSRELK
jgi:hypothetical protein